jgi:hypothetical protein
VGSIIVPVTDVCAQSDSLVITVERGQNDACGFYVTVKNRNTLNMTIDAIAFQMKTADATVFYLPSNQPYAPNGWINNISIDNLNDTIVGQANLIAPGKDLGGFKLNYLNDGTQEYDRPKTIDWETLNSGNVISSGTITLICTPYQSYTSYDTASQYSQLNNCDPCFFFTVQNRNSNAAQIQHLRFQLISQSGFMRPSKCVPPPFWSIDSVTATSAYFGTDVNTIDAGGSKGVFQVCLRANQTVPKHSFTWWALDQQGADIDRDTIANIPLQACGAASDDDSVSVSAPNSCLYNLTLKNYHVTNLIAPCPITRLTLKMKTSGVQFDVVPNVPLHWKKTVTADSITIETDSASHALPGGVVSSDFSYTVKGATTTDFTIAWTTFRAQGQISTGQYTTHCVIAAPRGDSVTVAPGANQCDFSAHVINLHNTPASNIQSVILSIPSGSGELIPVGNSQGWDNVVVAGTNGTQIKYSTTTSPLTSGSAIDLNFRLAPKVSGQNVTLTYATKADDGTTISTANATINCVPPPTPCDTFSRATIQPDSCSHNFTVISRGNATINSVKIAVTSTGWHIAWAISPGANWTSTIDPSRTFVTFTSTEGLASGGSLGNFNVEFDPTGGITDSPAVILTTTDVNGRSCPSSFTLYCTSTIGVVHPAANGDPNLVNVVLVPNPTTSSSSDLMLTLGKEERLTVSVFDALGKTVRISANATYGTGTVMIPIELGTYPPGSYFVRIETPYGVVTKRLVKQ